ncbi:MAG TPA: M14 family metallopeptidase [Thermoanaerobaculaceae bacterium]|nr:M14 family metallopeptidase [Thermoanaerobaculaceae bacterium]
MKLLACTPLLALAAVAHAAAPVTVPEATGYARTSTYAEVMSFVEQVAAGSDLVAITTLATSSEGRAIPLVVLSREHVRTPEELRATGKPAMLVMANIHGGEVEGKEACQMLIRDVAGGQLAALLDRQVILVIPIFNVDGNEMLGHNRHDKGPELAGQRYNGQTLDLNRDYAKLETPEVRGLVRLFSTWDPALFVDMHTTNGSYHREPVEYATCAGANAPQAIVDFMWKRLFPAAAAALKAQAGYDSVPYGEFVDGAHPEKGWVNDAIEPRYGTNYVGLRNRLAILDENYSYADFRTRVLASYAYVRAVLEFTGANAAEIAALVRRADAETAARFAAEPFATDAVPEKLWDVTVKGWGFTTEPTTPEERSKYSWLGEFKVKPTDVPRDYTVPYLARPTATRTIALPAGYVILPGEDDAVANLRAHGLVVEKLLASCRLAAERWTIERVEPAKSVFQGHVRLSLPGHFETAETDVPAGSTYVDMRQPLARLIPTLLEPAAPDSLAAWGFFDRVIVRQWSSEPAAYPVLRLHSRPPVATMVAGRD